MRLCFVFAVGWFALLFAPSMVLAQAPQLPRDVQVTPARPIPGVDVNTRLRLPSESEREGARKVALARTLGLPISDASVFQPSLWLTPRQPWAPSGAGLTIANEYQTTPNYVATASMPHGFITLAANPPPPSLLTIVPGLVGDARPNRVHLRDIPSDPRDWLLVECIVSGAQHYNLFAGFGATVAPSVREERLVASGGRIAAAFDPSAGTVRWFDLDGYIRRENADERTSWQFGGCEITPIRP